MKKTKQMYKTLLIGCIFLPLALGACSGGPKLQDIVASEKRPQADRARDQYRHPVETLKFFGMKPDMTVVELWPGAGWYSRILAPYIREQGRMYAAHFAQDSALEYRRRYLAMYSQMIEEDADFSAVEISVLDKGSYAIAPPESADMVVSFRNLHNWISQGDVVEVLGAVWMVLREEGMLGIVEHRGLPGMSVEDMSQSGYVPEEYAIQLIESAGFRLVGRSEINANPKDTRDHPRGVWTLPPSLRLGEQDRQKYLAIGESDRFTLKFVKIQ